MLKNGLKIKCSRYLLYIKGILNLLLNRLNTLKKASLKIRAKVTIKRMSKGRQSDESSPENKLIYDGKNNF